MTEFEILEWIKMSWPGPAARSSKWLFVFGESLHFIGLCMLFGSLLFVDLRVMGFYKKIPGRSVLTFLPFAVIGFTINALTGYLLFSSAPATYWGNPAFLWKMGLILVAGLNALVFTIWEHEKVARLGPGDDAPTSARVMAAGSLIIWLIVLLIGRWLPLFTVGTN